MTDRYLKFLIRQHFLNRVIPPLESHKICGSNFLYDLFQAWVWIKFENIAQKQQKKLENKENVNSEFYREYYINQHKKKHKFKQK